MTIPGMTIKCPIATGDTRHPNCWPLGKKRAMKTQCWPDEGYRQMRLLIPGRVLHYLQGQGKLLFLQELLSPLAGRGRAHRGALGGQAYAQTNVKLKLWKLSLKSKYAVRQNVHRLACIWLSSEVTGWHVLSNSLACLWLVSAIPTRLTTGQQPGSGSRDQRCPRGCLFYEA